jgi:hypothetical protein
MFIVGIVTTAWERGSVYVRADDVSSSTAGFIERRFPALARVALTQRVRG